MRAASGGTETAASSPMLIIIATVITMPVMFAAICQRRATSALILAAGLLAHAAFAQNVLTYHNDNARTGLNPVESVLTPANVASSNFGKLFTVAVDGYVYAQPLIVTNVAIAGQGTHDVVYIATEHDSVYAFDAYTNGPPLWQTSFLDPASGVTTVSSDDVSCGDLVPEIGITSTPVIDPVTGTIYVSAKTKEVSAGVTNFVYRLHALDLATGTEKFGGPAVINAVVTGSGDGNDNAGHVPFEPLTHLNRCALALVNGVIYLGFASHCDNGPYHGWLIGYDATNLSLTAAFNSTPNGSEGGFWQAGCGPVADSANNLFLITGNGSFNPTNGGYSDTFLKFSTASNTLSVADYFTPYNQNYLAVHDLDLGSGGPLLLPDEVGTTKVPHLLVGAGKQGMLYLINRDSMGGYKKGNNSRIVQNINKAIGGCFSTPAYFNQAIYCVGVGDVIKRFAFSKGKLVTKATSRGPSLYGFPGATPSVSANGTNTATVWAVQSDAYDSSGPAVLHAYSATNVAKELFRSDVNGGTNAPGPAVKFSVPTVANGHVYVGGQYSFTVFGLFTNPPVASVAVKPVLKLEPAAAGHFHVRAAALPAGKYVLQASTNLMDWTSLQTNTSAALRDLEFQDEANTNLPSRFYRVLKLP